MSGLTPGTSYVSNAPGASGPGLAPDRQRDASCLARTSDSVYLYERVDGWTYSNSSCFLVEHGFVADARELPRGDVREVLVVAERLAVLGLVLLAEVPAADLVAVQRVAARAARRTRGSRRRGRPSRATGCASRSRRARARSSRTPRGSRGSPTSAFVEALLGCAPCRSCPTAILPSSRWMSSTVRVAVDRQQPRDLLVDARSPASRNAGSSVGTGFWPSSGAR